MSKKLAVAQFGMQEEWQVKEVIKRFSFHFPSLYNVEQVTKELLTWIKTGEYSSKIQDAIDNASCGNEWPASVKLVGEDKGNGYKTFEMIITPYTGDRYLRIRHSGEWGGCGWEWFIECDYRDRPSLLAADKVIELFNDGLYYDYGMFKWNDPEWVKNIE